MAEHDARKANSIDIAFSDLMFTSKYQINGPLPKREHYAEDMLLRLVQEMSKMKLNLAEPKSWNVNLRVYDDGVDEYDTHIVSGGTAARWAESTANKLDQIFSVTHTEPEIGFAGVIDGTLEEGILKSILAHYTDKFRF